MVDDVIFVKAGVVKPREGPDMRSEAREIKASDKQSPNARYTER